MEQRPERPGVPPVPPSVPPTVRPGGGETPPELQRALGDLEHAVRQLADSAKEHLSGRAIAAIDEAAARLQRIERRQLRGRSRYDEPADDQDRESAGDDSVADAYDRRDARRQRRSARAGRDFDRQRRRLGRGRLYRVPQERRIAGVCAGLARRWGVETWVARCAAVTALVFMPQFAFVGYWVLYFVMDPTPPEGARDGGARAPESGRAPIAGFDRGLAARERMRTMRSQFDALEGRLRKMEGYVTSSRYELDRAMQEIGG